MRAFIGFKVPASKEILEKLTAIGKYNYIKNVEPENLHVCLKFLGEIDENQAEEIKKFLNEITSGKFSTKLKSVSAFPNNDFIKVVKIDVISEGLKLLQKNLEDRLEKIGFSKENREFLPHLTLARVKRRPDDSLKKLFDDKDYGTFEIDKIELIKSELTPEGPIYKRLHVKKL